MTMTAAEPSAGAGLLAASRSPCWRPCITSPGTTGTDEPPGITALSLRPAAHAAGDLEQVRERDAERHLEVAGLRDVAGDREDHRAARVRRPEAREPLRALAQDRRHRGEALRVVDRGRLAVQAEVGRERRLEARLALLALERLEQRGFLAADVGAGADERVEVEVDAGAAACSCRAARPRRPPSAPPRSAERARP